MTPQQAYDWLAPKLTSGEREALDVVFASVPPSARDGRRYGCHCDLEPGMKPDGCVLDEGRPFDCVNAQRLVDAGKGKEDCPDWKPVTFL